MTGLTMCQAVCRALSARGVRHVFGVPGTQNVPFYEAMRRAGLRQIVPTHELAAAFMAGAMFRAGGGPGVLATIPGPGLAYTIAGLAEARLDSAAMLYVVNGTVGAMPGFGPQALDQRALLLPVCKAIVSVSQADRAEEAVKHAWEMSLEGEPGPVVLELRADTGASGLEVIGERESNAQAPAEADMAAAWRFIGGARRPVVIAGQGALGAAGAVDALVHALGVPIITTPSARGIVDECDELAMGFDVLRGTTEAVNTLLDRADAILVLGAKLAHNGSAGARLRLPRRKLVRVDTSRRALDTVYPAAHALEMDVGAFLASTEFRRFRKSRWNGAEVAAARRAIRQNAAASEPFIAGVEPARFFAALGDRLPARARVVTDTGLHQVMLRRHLEVASPGGLLMPSDLQSMGFGLPGAIAAGLADPSRPVVAVIGDGGLRMMGFELATAVREGVSLTAIVFVDGCLNQIRMQQLGEFGAASGTEIGKLDLCAFADTVGARYASTATPAEVAALVAECAAADGVTLIEVPVGDTPSIVARAMTTRVKGAARATLGEGISARIKALIRG